MLFPAYDLLGRGVSWLRSTWDTKDLIGNPADKLQAELKLIGFRFGLKGRPMLGFLAEPVSPTAQVASLLTPPVAMFKNNHIFGYVFECFLVGFGNVHFIQRPGKLNTLYGSGVGVTNLSKVWVTKHYTDNSRGKVRCKPQSIFVHYYTTCIRLGEGVGRGRHLEVSELQEF